MLELVRALAALDTGDQLVVFVNRGDAARVAPTLPSACRVIALPFRSRLARLVFQQAVLPAVLARLDVSVLHSPSFFAPLARTATRHVLTVHDVTFFTMPEAHNRLRRSRAFRAGVLASARRADRVLVPSRSVAAELRRVAPDLAPDAVTVVPLGISRHLGPRAAGDVARVRARLGLQRDYLLHVGTLEPRKNLDVLLDAYERVVRDDRCALDLALVGRTGWDCARLIERMRSPTLASRVHHLGYVSDDDLALLYAGARLFVFPSAYEGFGLPPLEAMTCGAPVLASPAGGLAENLEGAAELVEPTAEAIASAVLRLTADPAALNALRVAGLERARRFTWEVTARATHDCYRAVASRR